MADSYDRPYSSAGTPGHKQYTPTLERVVTQKRFDPQERLEVNTRKVEKRKEVAAQVETIREEIRSRSMPFSTMTPTFIDPRETSVRRCRCFRQQQQRLDDLTLAPSRSAKSPMLPIEENLNRIVMPNRLNPQLKLEMKQKDESEKPKPSLAPKKPPRQRRPGQGSVVDTTLAHQAIPGDTQSRRSSSVSLSAGHGAPSEKRYSSLHLKTSPRGSDPLHELSPIAETPQTPWDPFCVSSRVFGLDSNTYRDFLGDKGAALVMFYNPTKSSCIKGKKIFVKAAESTVRENAAFAAVNCSVEESLCFNEGITNLPTYKLYSQGQLINIVKDTFFFNDRDMKKFVEKAPALAQEGLVKPSCKYGKTLLKKAIEKIKRHK
ncbi:unnamed protein product [Candidula unifasciata]|uniref:Thioredoxin domain-containing protein n=1 Tax=Candidula unifasciata TaxID=100452 RepID=A0A8S3YDZ4_9EUPU|nr:unnamed protein product [Candidula unifasciata]